MFSAFTGAAPKYNYMATLSGIKAHKLFLLDDIYNPVNTGSYYLGRDGDWFFIGEITQLISDIVKERNIHKTIMIGSSKGGSSALYYGIKTEADFVISGAPQYHIGKYLNTPGHKPILEAIMGDASEESVEKLDRLIKDEIAAEHRKKPEIFLHYSPKEHTYKDHIFDMITDLRSNGFAVNEDADYTSEEHGEVKNYFPSYLVKTIKQLITR